MSIAIRIEGVSKLYRLGQVGTGTISHDLNRWWHRIRGKEDPYKTVGQRNDQVKAKSDDDANAKGASKQDYVWALRNINLDVQQGEILGIIGKNGAGKSTLLKLLSRVTAPTDGLIKTKGRIASLLEVGTGMHPELTGKENIYLNGAILGMKRREITNELDKIVEFSGCQRYLDTPVKRYSSGMQVRLGFAVAAHLQCEILVVDEVLAVGDIDFQNRCLGKMRAVADSGRTVLFVTHQLGMFSSLCSRGVLVDRGQIAFEGDVGETLSAYQSACSGNRDGDGKINSDPNAIASVMEIWTEDRGGHRTRTIRTGEDVTIQFRLAVSDECPQNPKIDVAFGIHSATTGMRIAVVHSSYYGVFFDKSDAGRELFVRINRTQLAEDTYNVRVAVIVNGVVVHHLDDGILDFDVRLDDYYGTGSPGFQADAPLILDCDWCHSSTPSRAS